MVRSKPNRSSSQNARQNIHQTGFTLVELIVVIVITGVLSTVLLQFITVPIESYQAVSRRAQLTDIADTAMQRLSYEIRTALPNSVRVCPTGNCVEFLRVVSGGRYRAAPPGNSLSFNPDDDVELFDYLGPLSDTNKLVIGSGSGDCAANRASCVVIYNTGLPGGSAWQLDNMATLTGVNTGLEEISFNKDSFSGVDDAFPQASPNQRFFLVDTPVSYLCDNSTGSLMLRRYQDYAVFPSQNSVNTHSKLNGQGASHALLADQLTDCSFAYSAGTPTRNAVLTIRLTVSDRSENVTLLQQVSVVNQP